MKSTKDIRVVNRPEWTPKSLQTDRSLIREGCEKIGGHSFIRMVRWNRRRRAFVLEALVRTRTKLLRKLDTAASS